MIVAVLGLCIAALSVALLVVVVRLRRLRAELRAAMAEAALTRLTDLEARVTAQGK